LKPNDPGYTYDPVNNPVVNRQHGTSGHSQVRIDRILLRSDAWIPVDTEILGNKVFNEDFPDIRPSDHFGLMTRVSAKN
jgi:tyrosyl-DNA phosphodiesterase 2